eukprot:1271983-Prymnesium_polylepis.1
MARRASLPRRESQPPAGGSLCPCRRASSFQPALRPHWCSGLLMHCDRLACGRRDASALACRARCPPRAAPKVPPPTRNPH